MGRKRVMTLRSAFMVTVAVAVGSAVGATAEMIAADQGVSQPGLGQLTTAITCLWIIDRLNALIDDDDQNGCG
jgi:hypothetical protein